MLHDLGRRPFSRCARSGPPGSRTFRRGSELANRSMNAGERSVYIGHLIMIAESLRRKVG
jgi:hypothetical protein